MKDSFLSAKLVLWGLETRVGEDPLPPKSSSSVPGAWAQKYVTVTRDYDKSLRPTKSRQGMQHQDEAHSVSGACVRADSF